jgi:hypothetical protein
MSSGYGNIGADRALAASKVNGPAIFLMVTAGIGILGQLLSLLLRVLGVAGAGMGALGGSGSPEAERIQQMFAGGLGIVTGLIGLAVGVVIFLGAMKMKNLQSWGFALTSAILAMIPCISPCCCLGLPAGIWAIIVLVDANTKASFTA